MLSVGTTADSHFGLFQCSFFVLQAPIQGRYLKKDENRSKTSTLDFEKLKSLLLFLC